MSNHHIAMTAARATPAPRLSFWRRLFGAWVRAHARRIDGSGHFAYEH